MKNLLLLLTSLFFVANVSYSQCNGTFTFANITCDSVNFSPVSTGSQFVYFWDFGDGNTSMEVNPNHAYSSDGSYVVILTLQDTVAGCFQSTTNVVQINCTGPCNVSTLWTHNQGSNCDVFFVSTAMNGTPPYTFFWDFGDGTSSTQANPIHVFPNNSGWTPCLTVTDANGCVANYCSTINVNCNPQPCNAQFTYSHADCDSLIFYPVLTGPQYTYFWDFGDGNTSTDSNPANEYSADGTYLVVLTIVDTVAGCQDVLTVPVDITCGTPCAINGAIAHNIDPNCLVHFVSTAYGGTDPYTYFWNFGDGNTSTAASPLHIYSGPGIYTATLLITDANGCEILLTDIVQVACPQTSCDASFNYTLASCDNGYFIPASSGLNYSYLWDFGDGTTSTQANPQHIFANGTYQVWLVLTDTISGCTHSTSQWITINCATQCNIQGIFTYNQNNCDVQFVNSVWGGQAPFSYYWNFGDGTTSTDVNPVHHFSNNAVYTVCLTVTDANNCDTTICDVVTISCNQNPCDAAFNFNMIGCDSVYFAPVSVGSQYQYQWFFGDGGVSSSPNPVHHYTANGIYTVQLVVTNNVLGCGDQTFLTITIDCGTNCSVNGAFAANVNSTNCTTQFVSTAFGGTAPYTYFWNFGDGTTSTLAHPLHSYPINSVWTPCLTITDANGCDTTICQVVQVNCTTTSCDAQFTFTYQNCNTLFFVPASNGLNYTYNWDFGDGTSSTLANPSHTYATDGVYIVYLYVSDSLSGCFDQFYYTIQINCGSTCTVNGAFNYNQNPNTCEFYFVSTAFGGQAPYTYLWNFGDGNTSTLENPIHAYPNGSTWTPCLTITDALGCDTTICNTVFSNCNPQSCDAAFTWSMAGCDSVVFVPISSGPGMTYYWDFGDGFTSTEQSPIHGFADGIYVITLVTADTIFGCNDQSVQTIVIDCGYTPCTTNGVFTYNLNTVDCSVQFVSSAFGGTAPYSYFWNFGDGSTSTDAHPFHQYPNNSIWTPCLTITDVNGCDTTICYPIQVNCSTVSCNAQFTFTYLDCDVMQFYPAAVGPQYSYFWDFGDGTTSTDQSPVHTFSSNGTFYVILQIVDTLSLCQDIMTVPVTINCANNCNILGVATYTQNTNNCEFYFLVQAWGGQAPYTYYWNFGDGTSTSQMNPTHQYPNNTTWTPCVTITDANGCDTTICQVVTSTCISNSCNASFNPAYITCDSIWFFPGVNDPNTYDYFWDFGDGSTSTSPDPTHVFASNGTYIVVLVITDSLSGCSDAFTMQVPINCGTSPCNVSGAITWQPDSADCSIWLISSAWGGQAPYSYFWNFGDGTTSGLAHPTHQYPTIGVWTPCLTITDALGCDTTICMQVTPQCTSGIEEEQNSQLLVYPNPSSGLFNLQTDENISQIMIYDMSGKLILEHSVVAANESSIEIDLSMFEDGIYILQVSNSITTNSVKLIKQ